MTQEAPNTPAPNNNPPPPAPPPPTPPTGAGAKVPTTKDMIDDIRARVRMTLIEDYRDERSEEVAIEMFPFLDVEEDEEPERDLTSDEEKAVTARLREDVEKFKAGLDKALEEVPSTEGYISPLGTFWEEGSHVPFKDEWTVFLMYERKDGAGAEKNVVAYVYPNRPVGENGKPVPFAKLTLPIHAPGCVISTMSVDAFRNALVQEAVDAYYGYWGEDGHLAIDEEKPA